MFRFSVIKFIFCCAIFCAADFTVAATKIMPLGDSITGSPGCWRAYLWQSLQQHGYTDIDFVGSLPAQGCAVAHDGDNEGHGGILATNMANQNQLPAWLAATHPDMVLMHLGTNDVWSSKPTATILSAFTTLVQQMRASNPAMKIVVAKIIPMDSARSCSSCADGVVALNNALSDWAAGLSTVTSPITLVDMWTGFSAIDDTYDGVHPTDAGHQKMAAKWYPVVAAALSGNNNSSSSSSARSSTISSASSKSSASSVITNEQCNWYGTLYALCVTTASGWGYENNKSCIARSTCASQPAPYGIVGATASASSVASSVKTSSSVAFSSSSKSSASAFSSSKSPASSSSSSSSAVSSTSSSATSGNLSCVYVVTNSWGTGFTSAIRITNKSTAPITGWTTSWQFSGANRLTSFWNATVTGANPYSATNLSWNGNLAAGQTAEFGMQGNTNGGSIEIPVVNCQ